MAATDIGTGSAITFQSGFFAEIRDIQWSNVSRAVLEAPHSAGAGLITIIPGRLMRPPQLDVEINLDPDIDVFAILVAVAEVVTLTYPLPSGGTTAANWSGTGFAFDYSAGVPVEDVMTGTLSIQYTTDITVTAST